MAAAKGRDQSRLRHARRRLRARAAMAVALAVGGLGATAAAPARAEEHGQPQFPRVDPDKSADELFAVGALGIIRVGGQEWRAFRGRYRDFVAQDDFLNAVGRPDLAGKRRSQRNTANLLGWGGGAVALTGVVFLLADAEPRGFQPPVVLSLGLVAGGLASWIASSYVEGPVASQDELESMADGYNQGLRANIERQLSPENRGTVARARRRARGPWRRVVPWQVVPWIGGRGDLGLMAGVSL